MFLIFILIIVQSLLMALVKMGGANVECRALNVTSLHLFTEDHNRKTLKPYRHLLHLTTIFYFCYIRVLCTKSLFSVVVAGSLRVLVQPGRGLKGIMHHSKIMS